MRINDVFFAAHAACITLLTLGQCMVYERGAQRVHEHTRVAFAIVLPLTVTYAAAAWLFPADISVISCAPPGLTGGSQRCRACLTARCVNPGRFLLRVL